MVNLVAEGAGSVQLLRRVLPSAGDCCLRLLNGGDGRSALSMASSVRGAWEEPVILLLNARSVDQANVAYQRENKEDVLALAGPPLRAELVFAVPELEIALFCDPAILERTLGVEMTEEDRIEARFIPKKVLARLLERSGRFADEGALIDALDDWAVRRIAEHPLIGELEALIADVRENPVPEELRLLLRRTG
jgi:hypothetical protein